MEAICQLAVREENIMAPWVELSNMRKNRDKPIRNFAAIRRGHASQCKFIVKCTSCTNEVSYMDQLLKDSSIPVIYESDIKLEILGNQNQEMN